MPHLIGPDGLRAKWRALLYIVALLLFMPFTLEPVNWLSERGMLRGRSAWDAAVHWAVFVAAVLPAFIASRLERRPVGEYGLPMKSAFGSRFWEGVAWGLGALTLLMGLLYASRSVSFVRAPSGPESLAFPVVWAATILGIALFEQYSMRGYLQFTLGRSMGFWRAAVLVTVLFSIEDLLSPSRRDVLRFAGSVAYGLFYCLTLLRTGSLWFAVGLHFAFGWGLVFLFGMPTPISSPEPDGAILHPVIVGPDWLTGGKYGPDGSVLTLVVIALLALGVNRRFPRGREEGRLGRDAGGGALGDERIELGA